MGRSSEIRSERMDEIAERDTQLIINIKMDRREVA
jgi:hypothetical protein